MKIQFDLPNSWTQEQKKQCENKILNKMAEDLKPLIVTKNKDKNHDSHAQNKDSDR